MNEPQRSGGLNKQGWSIYRKAQIIGGLMGAFLTILLLTIPFPDQDSGSSPPRGDNATALSDRAAAELLACAPTLLLCKIFGCTSWVASILTNKNPVAMACLAVIVNCILSMILATIAVYATRIISMKIKKEHVARFLLYLLVICAAIIDSGICLAHDVPLHMKITESAFLSSDSTTAFLSNYLGPSYASFTTAPLLFSNPSPYTNGTQFSPLDWLKEGSYWEDMQLYGGETLRSVNHFYTLVTNRQAGQAPPLTDDTEHPNGTLIYLARTLGYTMPFQMTNSFAWGSQRNISGPFIKGDKNVGTNTETWQNARDYETAALTNQTQASRNSNLAHMLFSLGHVLHLNQDLSQPDHVRNDNHYDQDHRYIENFGVNTYQNEPNAFPLRPHGWTYWQSNGFNKLRDYWDRALYNGNASALNSDAGCSVGAKLGLAEFSNGNFLGEDAVYNEVVPSSDSFHHFPFPSLITSTQFKTSWRSPGTLISGSFLKNGTAINRVYLNKISDGITFSHHSILDYLDAALISSTSFNLQRTVYTPSINDTNVLQDYHSILIPKAIEYSSGILDYFFRGTIFAQTIGTNTDDPPGVTNLIYNLSSQSFSNGTFHLFYDDTNATRTEITNFTSTYSGSLAANSSFTMVFTPATNAASYLMVYQGSIGNTDPVDTNIAIATAQVQAGPLPFAITNCYNYYVSDSFLSDLPATISTNLASGDFPFTPTSGNYEAFINGGTFDDGGTIGGVATTISNAPCGYPATFADTPVAIPTSAISVVSNHLEVTLTCTDICPIYVGWTNMSITWQATPAP